MIKKYLILFLIMMMVMTTGCTKSPERAIEDSTQILIEHKHPEITKEQAQTRVEYCNNITESYNLNEKDTEDLSYLMKQHASGEIVSKEVADTISENVMIAYNSLWRCISILTTNGDVGLTVVSEVKETVDEKKSIFTKKRIYIGVGILFLILGILTIVQLIKWFSKIKKDDIELDKDDYEYIKKLSEE